MGQTYSEFKTYVTTYLWRQNDTVLMNNLDKIIRMAHAEINRKLNIQRREVNITINPTSQDYSLPTDFYQVISLVNAGISRLNDGEMQSTTKAYIEQLRAKNTSRVAPYYYAQRASDANTLFLVGPFSISDPGDLRLQYRTKVPDFETDDTSWLEEDYLDLYLYTVLKHCGIFSREDERIQFYAALAETALQEALTEDNHEVRFGGSPLHMQPHRVVPRTRRT